jgi:hypothetical protein
MVENMTMFSEVEEDLCEHMSDKWELGLVVTTVINNLCTRKTTSVFHCQNIIPWKIHGYSGNK